MEPSDTDFPFALTRLQFPNRPCFAMSISKSRGQALGSICPTTSFPAASFTSLLPACVGPIISPSSRSTQPRAPVARKVVFREILQWVGYPADTNGQAFPKKESSARAPQTPRSSRRRQKKPPLRRGVRKEGFFPSPSKTARLSFSQVP